MIQQRSKVPEPRGHPLEIKVARLAYAMWPQKFALLSQRLSVACCEHSNR